MKSSDQELERLLAQNVKGVAVDAHMVRSHVMRPPHLAGAFSDHGPEGGRALFVPKWPPPEVPYNLDVGAFGAALHDALKDTVAGYAAELRQNGQRVFTNAWQFAKRSQEQGGSEPWTIDVQQHLASVSKLLTAMAMTRLLSERSISPDAQIIDYLPDYWSKGPNIEYIVFRNLLNHTSGLTAPDVIDFDIMKSAIATGISLDQNAANHLGYYRYENLNYALCRILLAVINGNIARSAYFPPFPFFQDWNDAIWDLVTIASYQQFVQTRVFRPSGVFGATMDHPAATALAYVGPGDSAPGWNSGNLEEICGGDSWHLSVRQLLDVMGEFRRGGDIVTPEAAQAMLENMFGVDPFPIDAPTQIGLTTPAGVVYCKPGDWYDVTGPKGRHEQSLAYFLPQDMELVVLANSQVALANSDSGTFRDLVTQAYLNSLTMRLSIFTAQ